jgi:hypothetical protein
LLKAQNQKDSRWRCSSFAHAKITNDLAIDMNPLFFKEQL